MSELSHDARELIARARPAEQADASAKKRVRVALAAHLGSPVPAPVSPTAPAAGALGAGLSASKLVFICSLTAAGVAGTTALVKSRHAPERGLAPQRIESSAPRGAVAASPGAPEPLPLVPSPPTVTVPGIVRPLPEPVRRVSMRAAAPRPPAPVEGPAPAVAPSTSPEQAVARERAAAETVPSPAPATAAPERSAAALVPVPSTPRESPRAETPSSSWRASQLPAPVADRDVARITLAANPSKECSAERELRLLSGAQAALRARDGQHALDLLAEHTATCPSATFWQERSAARVLALCLLHREPQALAEAAQLVSLAPRSPLLARLRTSCAAAAVKP